MFLLTVVIMGSLQKLKGLFPNEAATKIVNCVRKIKYRILISQ